MSYLAKIDDERARSLIFCSEKVSRFLLGMALVVLAACGSVTGSDPEADRVAIEAALDAYLPKLAEAYRTKDASVLEGAAVPKEVVTVQRNLDLLKDEGRELRAVFKQLTVEDFSVWNYSNAFVSTFEVWDLQVYVLGTDTLTSEAIDQRNRVKYQMKRIGEEWVVLLRQIEPAI